MSIRQVLGRALGPEWANPQGSGWARPLVQTNAGHVSTSLATQILVWGRVLPAAQYVDWFFYCNILALGLLAFGVFLTTPYVRKLFRLTQIVAEGGPSLITDLIPMFVQVTLISVVIMGLSIADYFILSHHSIELAQQMAYLFVALIGLGLAITSQNDTAYRVLVACTVIVITTGEPAWFNDYRYYVTVALAIFVSSLLDGLMLLQNPDIMKPIEVSLMRVKMVVKFFLSWHIIVSHPFAQFLIGALLFFNMWLYIYELRWGSFDDRLYAKLTPVDLVDNSQF